ncbi:MAG: tetratricopeptide repeat protein [Opitutales bacterium]|nr:tetratricopeptide repeat protein [Opitutales bacterium]MDG1354803.1 tetratricopeptide repeat protein [Opitutales bacterium]
MTSQDSSVQLVDQAVLLFTLGEEKEAESLLVEYLSRHENDLSAWRALSEIRLSTKDFSAAENACRKALSINPDDLTSNVSLARILVAQGDKDGAEEASSKARVLGWKDELAQDEQNA